jgi:hypothetical protein
MKHASETSGGSRERRLLLILVGLTSLLLAAMFFGLLLPLERERATVAAAREAVAAERDALPGGRTRNVPLEHAQARGERRRLEERWEALRARLNTFKSPPSFTRGATAATETRIDFKVALFEARGLLSRKAEAGGVFLPALLGMDETIAAHEDAETRLWQLAAVVKLAERCIDIGVPGIESIEVLAPYDHVLAEEGLIYAREFPTRIRLACSFDETLQLLDTLLGEEAFFALRGFRAERLSKYRYEPLAATAVYSAQLFDVRQAPAPPEAVAEGPAAGTAILAPVTNGLGEDFFLP